MSGKHEKRRRRRWPRVFILLLFVAAALVGIYHCLVQKPVLTASPDTTQTEGNDKTASTLSSDTRKSDFYTILVTGVDDGNGGSDTNILVGVDAGAGNQIYCVSIPRDTGAVIRGRDRKINSAYNLGGTALLADTTAQLLGVPVDFTIEINLRGFVKLVDAIGGVDFDIPINMDYDDPVQDLSIHFRKGMQHLDGEEALEVVRFRHNNDGSGYGSEDIGRIGTQQAFLKAVAQQTLTLSNVDKISQFSRIFQEDVDTNLTLGNLAWLGQETISMGSDNIHFDTLPGEWSGSRSLYLLDPEDTLELVNTGLNPYTTDRTLTDMDIPS